jgi:hypothetical protein
MTLRIWSINSRNIQRNYVKLYRTNVRVVGREVRSVLTAEGRTPPNAVYKESFPTGIPIPWKNSNDRVKEVDCILNCENRERERERERGRFWVHTPNLYYTNWNSESEMPYLAAKIPKPQYTLTISHNNNLNSLLWPIFQDF